MPTLGCPICHSEDTNFRLYGEKPQFALIACFECAQVYTRTMKPLRMITDEEAEIERLLEGFDLKDI